MAVLFTNKYIQELQANSDVEGIYEDVIGKATATQTNATWGLARLSSKNKLKYKKVILRRITHTIVYKGVYLDHEDFGGRAKWGATFGGYPDIDDNGHGTHCAGIAAGNTYGVAKHANIIAVKVMNENKARASDALSGLDYIQDSFKICGHPSIVSISITWPKFTPLDDAVAQVSAGNDGKNASDYSPGCAPSAITVAASNIEDQQTWYSNYGSSVDIFAPGDDIVSAFIGGIHATAVQSGTSMAAPYVSGLAATLRALGHFTADEMRNMLHYLALKKVLSDVSTNLILA
ncbi:hypothetical protein C0995_006038 [Termitomyces sp. Mi166|nr:hypothetical protein C0995_006038 [Termitomyces sp. Mi166\